MFSNLYAHPVPLAFLQNLGPIEVLCVGAPLLLIIVLPFWQIFSKAGLPGALSLLMVFPIVNLIVLYYLAFSKWPLEKKADSNPPRLPSQKL